MAGKLLIVWDFDSALGQINSTLPYNFAYTPIYQEIENVQNILSIAKRHDLKMTFACLGFAAEEGIYPFNIPDVIKKIHDEGHEVGSHSWRHEWFPYLTDKQIYKTLERSKSALEKCIGEKNSVKGFVPPHSRPMSWYRKFSLSLGDRAFLPVHKGSDMGFVLKQLSKLDFKWCRVLKKYNPVWKKVLGNSNTEKIEFNDWEIHDKVVCVPQHYTGFDTPALQYLEKAAGKNLAAVIVGHPAALSRNGSESSVHFDKFIERVVELKSQNNLEVLSVSDYIAKYIFNGVKEH